MAVRSANRAARVAERTLLAGLRPLLVTSRLEDPMQKIFFADQRYLRVEGGRAQLEVDEDAILMVISLRNAGAGVAVLDSWRFYPARLAGVDAEIPTRGRSTGLPPASNAPPPTLGSGKGHSPIPHRRNLRRAKGRTRPNSRLP